MVWFISYRSFDSLAGVDRIALSVVGNVRESLTRLVMCWRVMLVWLVHVSQLLFALLVGQVNGKPTVSGLSTSKQIVLKGSCYHK